MGELLFTLKLLIVHLLYILYSGILWTRLYMVAEKRGFGKAGTITAAVVWSLVYVALNFFLIAACLKSEPSKFLWKSWIHVPSFMFIFFNVPPYSFTLRNLYAAAEAKMQPAKNCTTTTEEDIGNADFIFLQIVAPLIFFTFILYPRHGQNFQLNDYLGLALQLINIFDIMGMVSGLNFINDYGGAWLAVYYVSIGTAILLIAFPVKISSDDIKWSNKLESKLNGETTNLLSNHNHTVAQFINNGYGSLNNPEIGTSTDLVNLENSQRASNLSKQQREDLIKILKVSFTLVFIDIMFASMRFKIMVAENSVGYWFNLMVKNIILASLHTSYLVRMLRIYVLTEKKLRSVLRKLQLSSRS